MEPDTGPVLTLGRANSSIVSAARPHRLVTGLAVVILIVGVHYTVRSLGGASMPYAHLGYVPVLFAAAYFGLPGGLIGGLAVGIALGPLMPMSGLSDAPQPIECSLFLIGAFVTIGLLAGVTVRTREQEARTLQDSALRDYRTRLPNHAALLETLRQDGEGKEEGLCIPVEVGDYEDLLIVLGPETISCWLRGVSDRLGRAVPAEGRLFHIRSSIFMVYLPRATVDEGVGLGGRICESLSAPIEVAGTTMSVNAVFGVVQTSGMQSGALLQSAMATLVTARRRRQAYAVFESEFIRRRREDVSLVADLKQALIDGDGLDLHFQPVVDLCTGRCRGAEALVRWTHPTRGPISPARFIPIIEQTNLMRTLTRWVVGKAVSLLAENVARQDFSVAVNVSVRDLEDPEFPAFVRVALEEAGVPGHAFRLELTETALAEDIDLVIDGLQAVRAMGVSVAIDDFGSAHASLEYLKRLPADVLKIDKGFVRDLANQPADRAIVRAAIALAREMQYVVVAEGIEEPAVGRLLADWGCSYGQGYAFAPPMPIDELKAWLGEG